jgi:hypothetical protein
MKEQSQRIRQREWEHNQSNNEKQRRLKETIRQSIVHQEEPSDTVNDLRGRLEYAGHVHAVRCVLISPFPLRPATWQASVCWQQICRLVYTQLRSYRSGPFDRETL